ncbi:MAG: sel1 repeat family protein, partial [Gammaproteobacteria bacterium]|nr:sel1 repeat family protein [Gammaproteobacteria bacterium]
MPPVMPSTTCLPLKLMGMPANEGVQLNPASAVDQAALLHCRHETSRIHPAAACTACMPEPVRNSMNTPQEWFERGQTLLASNAHDTPAFAAGLELLKKSAAADFIDAQLTLGHVHAQIHVLPDAAAECARWYRQAAERGHPVAQDRLADLYMLGRGVPRDDAQALHWYARTAAQDYPHALCNLAYMQDEGLGAPPDARAAAE